MGNRDEVLLSVSPRSCHRRIIRLVAVEAGGRAGFDVSELDDLRSAVDELTQALLDVADRDLLLRVAVQGGCVVVRGFGHRKPGARSPKLPSGAELLIDAVTDHYSLDETGDDLSFVMIKQACGVAP
jgi:hypothetical protein